MILTNDFIKRWGEIVDEVEKRHIPLNCVRKVVFRNKSKRQKTVNLERMRKQGLDDDTIESLIESYIKEHEEAIASMEFLLDIKAVADQIQPETDKLLKDM